MTLFNHGQFTLHSGVASDWIIDCNALQQADIETLAKIVVNMMPTFGSVEGVPRGGLRLAAELEQFTTPGRPLLIVDDVCTTGGSITEHRAGREAMGIVIFSRGNLPAWCRAIWNYGGGQR